MDLHHASHLPYKVRYSTEGSECDLGPGGHIYNLPTTCHTLKQVKQNVTNSLALFFRSGFNALSDGLLRFAHCVAAKDPAVDWLLSLNSLSESFK